MGQERLGTSYFFISSVIGSLNSLSSGCKGGHRVEYKGHVCVKPASQDSNQVVKSSLRGSMDMEGGGAS